MVYNTLQHPHGHTLFVYTVYLVWEGGEGGEVREKVEGQQYTSIVPSSMGATVHKLGRKYQPWVNVSPIYKICKHNAAKSINRSILEKSRHLGFGVFLVHSSIGKGLITETSPYFPIIWFYETYYFSKPHQENLLDEHFVSSTQSKSVTEQMRRFNII